MDRSGVSGFQYSTYSYKNSAKTDKKDKIFNDPVHGHISIPSYCVEFIDTPQFARLRDLKQLGTSYFVFPGASHNRFEHSLGVSHLAGKLVKKFMYTQPELELDSRDMKIVRLAGLCHDLGHGPFSHAFEDWMRSTGGSWHHEEMSQKLVKYLIDDNHLDYSHEDISFLLSLISGEQSGVRKEKRFLFDIVANKRNSIDVDKFDYISRDSKAVGVPNYDFDASRLMKFSRVINDEICFHSKERYNVYHLFSTRYTLFKMIYSHRVSKAIEYMIGDAMTIADPFLDIRKSAHDVESYTQLTDTILYQIEYSKIPELEKARTLIKNIRKRKLYKFVDEIILPTGDNPQTSSSVPPLGKITSGDIVNKRDSLDSELREEDIIVHDFKMNYAMADRNPVDNVHFYGRWEPEKSFNIPANEVSMLLPAHFSERCVRVFCKDETKVLAAQTAFHNYLGAFGYKPSGRFSRPTTPLPSPAKPLLGDVTLHSKTARSLVYED